VRKLDARHPERSLKQISERMLFDHLIYLRDKERLRPSTLNQAVVALRMFYRDYLQRDWKLWEQFEIRRDQPLPVVMKTPISAKALNHLRAIGTSRFLPPLPSMTRSIPRLLSMSFGRSRTASPTRNPQ
jgi:Phage integrase, N-terminal SAM-like domain